MADELTLERVAHYPMPGMNAPAAVRFSPDGRLLSYLWSQDGSLVRQLWAYDLESGQTRLLVRPTGQGDTDNTVSAEEALRRERLRMRGFGVTAYAWAENQPVLLVPMLGRLFISDDHGAHLRELATGGEAIDPRLSPNGDYVAFVQNGELWALNTAPDSEPIQLTSGALRDSASGEWLISNGAAEFIAQEEMGRSSGFWWSRDGRSLAFTRVDVSGVTPFRIAHDSEDPPGDEVHRYPFAGGANARVRLGVINRDGSGLRWVSLGEDPDVYLARVDWAPDGSLFFQVERRDQRHLELRAYDSGAETIRLVLSESSDVWINLHDDLRFIEHSGCAYDILWSSERTGFRHLYLYSKDGAEVVQLTEGAWPVDRVIEAKGDWVYFLSGRESPLERHIYRVRLPAAAATIDPKSIGGGPERLTEDAGMHAALLSPSGEYLADLWDSTLRPPRLDLRRASGSLEHKLFQCESDEAERLGLTPPEFFTVTSDDGTQLHAALYAPVQRGAEKATVIVSIYGGPHVQQVTNSWGMTADLRAQYLARQGFAVLKLDNRGSARRGLAFEAAIVNNLGDVEVRDQVAAVHAVSERPGIDGTRVGVYGWSYGGYMTLMCLVRAPEVFRAGVAGAPVTDWDGYDTHYTERYMGEPTQNQDGYRSASAVKRAKALEGQLLIVHGMIDENVHFRHSVRFIDALIEAQKPFRLLPFPHERHMPRREEDRCFMESQLVEHFRRHL